MRILLMTLIVAAVAGSTPMAARAGAPAAPGQGPAGGAAPSTPTQAAQPRSFVTPAGLVFNAVRPDRVVDFELVIGYLQAALAASTDPAVQAQAKGWRFFKASEPGPGGSVLYVFVIDPAVANADYGLGRILSDAYPDRIQDIWKLYTGATTGGGSLLSLAPVQPPPLPAR